MKRSTFALIVLLLAGGCLGVAAQTDTVKGINAYCNAIDAGRKRGARSDLIFADVAATTSEAENWRAFTSPRALERHRRRSEVYAIAYVWQSSRKVVIANFTLSSESGDWVKYVYHHFRADGTVARVKSDYRTFNGDYMVLRERYFDRRGKQFHQTVRFLDLKTRRPKDPGSGVLGDDPDDPDFYLTTDKLPFAKLIRGAR